MAQIVETGAPPQSPTDIDPVTLDIIENALRNARNEMDAVLFRTALSPAIREQHDAFPLIADRQGRMVVGQFGSFIGGFLNGFDGEIRDGDIFFTSSPYDTEGAISHANDWLVLMPVYHSDLLVGWAAMFGHMTDVGGKVPGSLPTDATSIYEEGIVVPPIRLVEEGQLREDLLEMILAQVRIPRWNRSDLEAIVAACRLAARRIEEMCSRFGLDVYLTSLEALMARTRRAMSELVRRTIPETPIDFTDYVDDDGRGFGPFAIRCTMWREDDTVVLDFDGTAAQSSGSINFLLNENMLKMFFGVYMIMVFDPQILWNDGFYPLIDVRIPDGSLLAPRHPAALSCRTHALGRVFDVLGGLLGKLSPEFRTAAGFSSSPHLMYSGVDRSGEWFQMYQIGFGGVPGRPVGDGPDGHSMWPSFTNVPNEFLEGYFPFIVERYETVADSGGPGLHRGGNGIDIAYRFVEPGSISIHDDRWFTYPWGVNGGLPGERSRKVLRRSDGSVEYLPSKCDGVQVHEGDVLHYVTWGGGGWGDPLERDPDLVALEIKRGLITPEGARRYGIVLEHDGSIDSLETEKLRTSMRADRGAILDFDFGPSLDELRSRCLEETGLAPPVPPEEGARSIGTPRAGSTPGSAERPASRPDPARPDSLLRAWIEQIVTASTMDDRPSRAGRPDGESD